VSFSIWSFTRWGAHRSVWRDLYAAPASAAQSIVALWKQRAQDFNPPLLQHVVDPCLQAVMRQQRTNVSTTPPELLRVVVLPGFSLLCWAHALGLHLPGGGLLGWPSPMSGVLMESFVDESGAGFTRLWQLNDGPMELRPTWHEQGGPVPVEQLAQGLRAYIT